MKNLLLLLALTACGRAEYRYVTDFPDYNVLTDNQDVRDAVREFYASAPEDVNLLGVTVQVVDYINFPASSENSMVVGLCNYRDRSIKILSGVTESLGLLRQTVFHELAHCAAGTIGHPGEEGDLMHWSTAADITVDEADARLTNYWRNGR